MVENAHPNADICIMTIANTLIIIIINTFSHFSILNKFDFHIINYINTNNYIFNKFNKHDIL